MKFGYDFSAVMALTSKEFDNSGRQMGLIIRKFKMTGHSLGGAIASLAASYMVGTKLVNQTMVKLLTFGQPRVGDWEFADMHDEQVLRIEFAAVTICYTIL